MTAPIGIFDSGVGGLTILREVRCELPGRSLLYVADQAWAPYGRRSLLEVRDRAEAVTEFLVGRGADVIVVACNSASAAALVNLREMHPNVAFVGMEPAVKPAAATSTSGVVGVLATEATFQGALYASVVDRHAEGVVIVEQAAFGLATAVEEARSEDAARLLRTYLAPMLTAGMDQLVLGCTHYGFLLEKIRTIVGPDVVIVDPSPAVARQVGRVIQDAQAIPDGGDPGTDFYTTGDAARFGAQIEGLLGEQVVPVRVMI